VIAYPNAANVNCVAGKKGLFTHPSHTVGNESLSHSAATSNCLHVILGSFTIVNGLHTSYSVRLHNAHAVSH
jgi:hypothetical protein